LATPLEVSTCGCIQFGVGHEAGQGGAGINFLNTGDFYRMGHNEFLVGQAIKGRRDQALISVKFGALRSPSGQFLGIDVRPNSVKNFAAYSLQRLGVNVIDITNPVASTPMSRSRKQWVPSSILSRKAKFDTWVCPKQALKIFDVPTRCTR
jgi:Aldo/keto reductase family